MLTAEYIDGVKISDQEGIEQLGLDVADVDTKLIRSFAEQIFHSGFVHADPHPGNSESVLSRTRETVSENLPTSRKKK